MEHGKISRPDIAKEEKPPRVADKEISLWGVNRLQMGKKKPPRRGKEKPPKKTKGVSRLQMGKKKPPRKARGNSLDSQLSRMSNYP